MYTHLCYAGVATEARFPPIPVLARVHSTGPGVVGSAAQMVNSIVLKVTIREDAASQLGLGEHGGQTRARSLDYLYFHVDLLSLLCHHLLDVVGEHGPGGGGKEATDIGRWSEPGLLGAGLLLGPLLSLE